LSAVTYIMPLNLDVKTSSAATTLTINRETNATNTLEQSTNEQ